MAYRVNFAQRISDAIGGRISRLGEWVGVDALIYNKLTFWNFHRVAMHSAPGVVKTFREIFPDARRYVDIGAGSGAYAAALNRAPGLSCIACEHSPVGRKIATSQGVDCRPFDLNNDLPADLPGPFDVAYSFEVAEHVPEFLGRTLVTFIAKQAPIVPFTAAAPGQRGMGHINCQPKSYWIDRFSETGMTIDQSTTDRAIEMLKREEVAWWLTDNLMIFRRR